MRSLFVIIIALCAFTPAPAADLLQIGRVGVSVTEKKLTLAGAIEMALANNLDIEIERTSRDQAETAVGIAKGAFDPRMQFQPGYASNNTPTGSSLQGVDGKLSENTSTENFYYREKTPWWGSSFAVDFENGRTSTSNLFSSLNPYFNSRLLVSFTLPLLRNREIDQERGNLLIRRKQRDVSLKEFEVRVVDTVTTVQQAYWDLVAAREDVQVQSDAVELAARQLEQNRRMIDSGTLAPIELSASEAELERRKDTFLASVGTLTEVENNLKTLLLPDRHSETWSDQIVPVDTKTVEPLDTEDVHDVVAEALKRRPEMRQMALRKDANQVDQRVYSNQTKPQVNLVSSYASTGLGGTLSTAPNPFDSFQPLYERLNLLSAASGLTPVTASSLGALPGSLVGGYGTTLAGLFGGNYQSVQVGVQLDFTARNRAAQGNYTNTLIEAKRLKFEQSRTEQLIEAQVRNALQSIQTARQRITSAETGERAAREKLDSETRLFKTGESTNFFVLTRQNEYLDARRRAVLAHLDFNKAVARLEQAAGSTLANHGVTLR